MIGIALGNPGLREIFRLAVRRVYAYRVWSYLGVLQVFLQLILLQAVWQAVYGNRTTLEGIPIGTTVMYLTVVGLINFMIYPGIADEIQRRIDDGQVAVDLVRPVGFVRQMLALELGDSAGRWLWLVLVVPGLSLIGSLTLPDMGTALLFVLSMGLAFTVSVLIFLLVGLSGFWLTDVSGVRAMIGLTSNFLAGSMIPLWFMPDALRAVVEVLPFQAIAFLPASIWVEETVGEDLWRALALQGFWVLVLATLARGVWSRARYRIIVQGG